MAYDDRYSDRRRGPGWRGDPAFGDGWGNQVPLAQRPGSRWRGFDDDPYYADAERYGPDQARGYAVGDYGPVRDVGDLHYGGPGFNAGFDGPRFDRVDVGSAGTHGVHPPSSRSNPAYGFGPHDGTGARDAAHRHDPRYAEWRHRQIAALDQDYEEYRRETQARFDDEFGAWRNRRGAQREAIGRVSEHMEVLGSDGGHVGAVDKVRGDTLILTRSDPGAGGVHHAIPCGWIDRVEDKVTLNITGEEATRRWRTESRSRALFERPDSGSNGPRMLNRSFSGTYPDKD